MSLTASIWLLVILAILAANLPFLTERLLGVMRLPSGKSFWVRLAELGVYFGVTGMVAWGLEARAGGVYTQRWEFWAINLCLFIVLAYPGFVYRYLRRGARQTSPTDETPDA